MDDIEFRLAKKSDLARIADLSRDYVEHGLGWSWTTERVKKSYLCRDTNILVACAKSQNFNQPKRQFSQSGIPQKHQTPGSQVIGFGIMHYGPAEANLNLLAVVPQYRRLGIAKLIVQWLERPALVAGIDVVYLQCRVLNTAAQLFYQKLGYRKLRNLPKYYSGKESAVLMGHDLLIQAPNLFLQKR
jgi:ribosomal protein S18 acetylase RimI-like enzyme